MTENHVIAAYVAALAAYGAAYWKASPAARRKWAAGGAAVGALMLGWGVREHFEAKAVASALSTSGTLAEGIAAGIVFALARLWMIGGAVTLALSAFLYRRAASRGI